MLARGRATQLTADGFAVVRHGGADALRHRGGRRARRVSTLRADGHGVHRRTARVPRRARGGARSRTGRASPCCRSTRTSIPAGDRGGHPSSAGSSKCIIVGSTNVVGAQVATTIDAIGHHRGALAGGAGRTTPMKDVVDDASTRGLAATSRTSASRAGRTSPTRSPARPRRGVHGGAVLLTPPDDPGGAAARRCCERERGDRIACTPVRRRAGARRARCCSGAQWT